VPTFLTEPGVIEIGITLAVVDPDPRLRTRLAVQLGERGPGANGATPSPPGMAVGAYPAAGALAERLPAGTPAVVIFGPGMSDAAGLAEIEELTRSRPELGAILVTAELSTALLQQALRSGVRDVLGSPTEAGLLHESVARVTRTLNVVSAAPVNPGVPTERGRVITVSSTKGGAGKSVVATNLAVELARRASRPVVLVDGDLQFGDVSVLLRLNATHTVVDAVSAMARLDVQLVQSLLARHEPSGLLVLAAPGEPSFAERVSEDDIVRIIEVLQMICGHVVVDTPAQFNDVVLALIEQADDVVLVAGLDIPSIKNMKLGLQTLRMLGHPEEKLHLLLNRADSKVMLDVGEVEKALGLRAEILVPSDIVVPQSVNKGTPVVLDAPKSSVAKSFAQLANLFLPTAVPAVPAVPPGGHPRTPGTAGGGVRRRFGRA
jgi:pilus assembly protein CpaE